jgi:hypothetical protein
MQPVTAATRRAAVTIDAALFPAFSASGIDVSVCGSQNMAVAEEAIAEIRAILRRVQRSAGIRTDQRQLALSPGQSRNVHAKITALGRKRRFN